MVDKPSENNETVPSQPEIVPPRKPLQYDYSRSTPKTDSHWYSMPGQANPLDNTRSQSPTQPPHNPTRPAYVPPTEQMTPTRLRLEQRRQRQGMPENWAWLVIAVALLGLTVIVSMVMIIVLRSDRNGKASASTSSQLEPTSIIYGAGDQAVGTPVGGALEGNAMEIQPWDGQERFTVLVMGLDNRPGEEGSCRTDTMMIISIDPQHNSIGMMSIPRDTYVEIPGYGLDRINTACVYGELYQRGTGPRLAMQTVQYNFGIRVNDYVMVNFNSFISLIDRIGGIDIYVEQEIYDDQYPDMFYGYDPFYIAAGQQHLDGATALKYARSRHSTDDIDRGRRQQQVVMAVRDKIVSANMMDNLLVEAPGLWNDLNEGIETGLSLDQILRLAVYAKNIPQENIKSGVLNWDYLMSWTNPENGASLVIPDRYKLPSLMLEIFGEGYNQ
ncbi:MAG: LCP family protein [Chloroflexi bacterium]|nr:LCP family protein [Chloroflexota bacterium]